MFLSRATRSGWAATATAAALPGGVCDPKKARPNPNEQRRGRDGGVLVLVVSTRVREEDAERQARRGLSPRTAAGAVHEATDGPRRVVSEKKRDASLAAARQAFVDAELFKSPLYGVRESLLRGAR